MDAASLRVSFSFKAYRRPFRVPVRTSRGVWETREAIVVRVADDEGRAGLGEIAPIAWFRSETFVGALAWCESIGAEATVERLLQADRGLPCCAAAASAAIAAMLADEGETQAAGAEARRLPVAALLPAGWAALDAAERAAALGFTVYKIKIGVGDIQAEQALVDRLVGRLPAGARLRLDANGGLDVRGATRWLDAAGDWPVEFLEQPLPVEAAGDLVRLAGDHAVPVALDESVVTADDIKRWRDRGWPGLFVIKPALAGDAAALRAEVEVDPAVFVFSSALESDVGLAAGAGLALRCGLTRALGYGTGAFFHDDHLGGSIGVPWFGPRELEAIEPAAVWRRL